MRWAGNLPAGERRAQVVNLLDLASTMVDAAGAPALPDAEGRSFLDVAKDQAAPWSDVTFAEYCTDGMARWSGPAVRQRMVREGRWKLVYYHGERPQLFDLEEDPDETVDLALSEPHASIRDALVAKGCSMAGIRTRSRSRKSAASPTSAFCPTGRGPPSLMRPTAGT